MVAILALPAASPQAAGPATATQYLELSSVADGKCQIMSAGGKLRLMRNTHPNRALAYRLVRVFADKPQAGLVVGRIEPGEPPIKLGCTRIDGREQRWDIVTAELEP